jgi:hypothetical protein
MPQRGLQTKKRFKEEREDRARHEVRVESIAMSKKTLPPPSLPPSPSPAAAAVSAPPASAPTEDPFGYLLRIVEDARRAFQTFPEAMRRPMIAPTLRAIDTETQRLIANVEKETDPSEAR